MPRLLIRRAGAYVLDVVLLFVVLFPVGQLLRFAIGWQLLTPLTGLAVWLCDALNFSVPTWMYFRVVLSGQLNTRSTIAQIFARSARHSRKRRIGRHGPGAGTYRRQTAAVGNNASVSFRLLRGAGGFPRPSPAGRSDYSQRTDSGLLRGRRVYRGPAAIHGHVATTRYARPMAKRNR